jgi:2-C-methyl-D-erythritol 4-phosphate cytidylyltransferase
MLSAIIVAGGSSQRMGFDKLFARLKGEPVLAHSVRAFEVSNIVGEIILVGRADRLSELERLVSTGGFGKVTAIVPGGTRRQDSVLRGLERIKEGSDFVAVHDAARPLVQPKLIAQIFHTAQIHGGAASGAPVSDTLKRVNEKQVVIGGVERANLFAVETPQIFRRELLEKAYEAVFADGLEITDEISALELIGGTVVIVPNDEPNLKITYAADLARAEFLFRA